MTNYISDLTLNSVQAGKEQTKTNQYQTKDNGQSFNDVLNNVNKNSSKLEQTKSMDNRFVKDKAHDDLYKTNRSVDNQNPKSDNDLVNKTIDRVKPRDLDNQNLSKDISSKRIEKLTSDPVEVVKKTDNSGIDAKTDSKPSVASDPKAVVSDESNSQIKNQVTEDESLSVKDESTDKDEQSSTSNNSTSDDSSAKSNNPETENETANQSAETDLVGQIIIGTVLADEITAIQPELTAGTSSVQAVPLASVETASAAISSLGVATTQETATTQSAETTQVAAVKPEVVETSEATESGVNKKNDSTIKLGIAGQNLNIEKPADELLAVKTLPTEVLSDLKKAIVTEVEPLVQIKVSSDVVTDKKVTDKVLNDIKDKMPLEQLMLSEMDAEITESSQNSSNSFAKQQNASEQVVKLSIEPLVKADSVDFTNIITQDKFAPTMDKPLSSILQAPVKELNQTDILNQLNNKLVTLKSGVSEKLEIILKPENLGKINVEIQSIKGVISATLVAENQQVKELLEKNIESLRNNLNSQGLNLSNINVKIEEPNKSAFNNLNFGQGQFDTNANNNQQKSQNTYKSDYENGMSLDGSVMGMDDGTIPAGEFKSNNSLHAGMVDYKV